MHIPLVEAGHKNLMLGGSCLPLTAEMSAAATELPAVSPAGDPMLFIFRTVDKQCCCPSAVDPY